MPPKSIFRQPGARHFQLVHRSQRDPLIHDSEASKHVLKEFERDNQKGKARAVSFADDDLAVGPGERPNVGEAANYGIFYDDTEYDYMQHLKPVGLQEDGVESVLIEAPSVQKGKGKAGRAQAPIQLVDDLPKEALPSKQELPRNYESQEAIPSSISGFQPDMDPHLRQTLEALEDDAFVNGDLEDDFFGELLADGERGSDEDPGFEFGEWGAENGEEEEVGVEDWQTAVRKFKQAQKNGPDGADSDEEGYSEGGDTVGSMPQFSVIGGKKRRKGSSEASGYSMSSSSMFRNAGLTMIDERFDQIEKEYASDEEISDSQSQGTDEAPELLEARDDFAAMMNEFLDEYEILGGKMKPKLEGDTNIEKLDTFRRALGPVTIRDYDEKDDGDLPMPVDIDDAKDTWDCETILTTYSNLENHPRLIRARDAKAISKIRLHPKTGLPTTTKVTPLKMEDLSEEDEDDGDRRMSFASVKVKLADVRSALKVPVTRLKGESKEEKKSRKNAAKEERRNRRVEKKATRTEFTIELKKQQMSAAQKEKSRMKKL
ncbi:Low temperature viability protein-domain-containing protein [Thelephora terrestris]|uniref:Low temperature viability protein-domain-containing protein n=1 Tax=Thelephora terrestris TaxID=56493 RepID=A0A9P6HI47_9AGAM|nr:Low temperature viability protein-domain-containing protein [Thelephora terrestris]